MDVIIEDLLKQQDPLKLGDVVLYKTNYKLYLVTEIMPGKIAARNFDGETGLMGTYDSLEDLNKEFTYRGLHDRTTIYRSDEYELKLVRKGK